MKRTVDVTQTIEVDLPDDLLTPEFMASFREDFYNFTTPEQHIEHLAQLYARGLVGNWSFIEGYGNAGELGITFRLERVTSEAERPSERQEKS